MSSTRHAEPGTPPAQGGYMSSPEYADLRGLCGTAVAAKVALQTDPRARSLILFLDALSREPGSLKKVAAHLLAMFPERIGTLSMHKFGVKPGTIYDASQVKIVRQEVERGISDNPRVESLHYRGNFPLKGESSDPVQEPLSLWEWIYRNSPTRYADEDAKKRYAEYVREHARDAEKRNALAQKHPASYAAAVFVEACRRKLQSKMEQFLIELCINPAVRVEIGGPQEGTVAAPRPIGDYGSQQSRAFHYCDTVTFYFHDIIGALLEFKARHEQAALDPIAETTITAAVSRTISRGLRSRKIVMVVGIEGLGKSEGGKAWCEQHLGEARFIPLEGIVNKTTLFQTISKACGLSAGVQQKSQEMQTRIRKFLELSGVMLVIDEAHRLFSQTQRMSAQPELMNWIYTLWDKQTPVALLTTPQFIDLMDLAERQTGWNSGQFKRRVEKFEKLPDRLTEEDVRAVAGKLAPRFNKTMLDELADFAFNMRRQLDALKRALSAAHEFAAEAGREVPNSRDLQEGIKDAQATDLALTTPLDRERQHKGSQGATRRRRGSPGADAPQDDCGDAADGSAEPVEDTFADTEAPSRTVIPLRAVTVPA
jgi:hypothetical protein